MSSAAQFAANAANAQHSAGPQTDAGKAASSQNARTHGLSSADLFIPEAERSEFEHLQSTLLAELQPNGAIEEDLTRQFIAASWKLRRIGRMEAELFQNEPNVLLEEKTAKALDRLYRYQIAAERSYHRALKELKELQTNRVLRLDDPEIAIQCLPSLVSVEKTKRTQRLSAQLAKPQNRGSQSSARPPQW